MYSGSENWAIETDFAWLQTDKAPGTLICHLRRCYTETKNQHGDDNADDNAPWTGNRRQQKGGASLQSVALSVEQSSNCQICNVHPLNCQIRLIWMERKAQQRTKKPNWKCGLMPFLPMSINKTEQTNDGRWPHFRLSFLFVRAQRNPKYVNNRFGRCCPLSKILLVTFGVAWFLLPTPASELNENDTRYSRLPNVRP